MRWVGSASLEEADVRVHQVEGHDADEYHHQYAAASKEAVHPLLLVLQHAFIELDEILVGRFLFQRRFILDAHQFIQGAVHGHNDIADGLKAGVVRLTGHDPVDGADGDPGKVGQLLVGELSFLFQKLELVGNHNFITYDNGFY